MKDRIRKYFFVLAFLSLVITPAILAYFAFTGYLPGNGTQEEKVKGIREYSDIPLPNTFEELSRDTTAHGEQITIEVERTPEGIQEFYRSALLSRGWEVETESATGDILSVKYKMGEKKLTVNAGTGENEGRTIVSVEISNQ